MLTVYKENLLHKKYVISTEKLGRKKKHSLAKYDLEQNKMENQLLMDNQGQSHISDMKNKVMEGEICSLETDKMFNMGASQCFITMFRV